MVAPKKKEESENKVISPLEAIAYRSKKQKDQIKSIESMIDTNLKENFKDPTQSYKIRINQNFFPGVREDILSDYREKGWKVHVLDDKGAIFFVFSLSDESLRLLTDGGLLEKAGVKRPEEVVIINDPQEETMTPEEFRTEVRLAVERGEKPPKTIKEAIMRRRGGSSLW